MPAALDDALSSIKGNAKFDGSGSIPTPLAQWRRIADIKQRLANIGVEWDLSEHCLYLSTYAIDPRFEAEDGSFEFTLDGGWTASFDLTASIDAPDEESVLVEDAPVTFRTLLRIFEQSGFAPAPITWNDLGIALPSASELDLDCGEMSASVIPASIRLTSPSGRIFTVDGPEETDDSDDEAECSIEVTALECDANLLRIAVTVAVDMDGESIDGSYSFECEPFAFVCTWYDVEQPDLAWFTDDLTGDLSDVIAAGLALVAKTHSATAARIPLASGRCDEAV